MSIADEVDIRVDQTQIIAAEEEAEATPIQNVEVMAYY
jgi:hypothetical protein